MLRRDLISLIIVGVLIIGNFAEYMITSEPTFWVNLFLLPATLMLVILKWVCKPFSDWLVERVNENKQPKQGLSQHLKERAAAVIRGFGVSISSNMKSFYWPEKDVFVILWCDKVLMCSEKPDCSSITVLSTKYTDKDLEKFLDYAHKLIIDNMPKYTSKS